ncbi:MAG: hypothetical protein ACYC8T_22995 [Myxococcaceae bacterium]
MSGARLLTVALLLAGGSALAAPKKKGPRRVPGMELVLRKVRGVAQVTYVTPTRVYLDRGASDGLSPGQSLKLTRQGRAAGSCEVEWLSAHSASCAGEGLRVADRAALERLSPERPRPALPLVPADELARRRQVVQGTGGRKVEFKGTDLGNPAGGALVQAALSHGAWASSSSASGPFQQERVDLGLRGASVFGGARAWADLSVIAWGRRPPGARAFAGTPAQLTVREAEISLREEARSFAFAAGRTNPRFTPGLLVLDGVQGGWKGRATEGGLYAGAIPDAVTLAPSLSRFTAGGYFTHRVVLQDGLFQPEARVAFLSTPGGGRLEAEVAAHGWVGKAVDAHVQALFAAAAGGGAPGAPGLLEALRLDATLRGERLKVQGGVRYDWSDAREVMPLGAGSFGMHGLRADATASYELSTALSLGVQGGVAGDFDTGQWREYAGPELSFPTLLGERGALSLGYQEELGWTGGRSAYLQAAVFPHEKVRLLTRGSYFMESAKPGAEGYAAQEVGLYLGLELKVRRWLWLRGSLLGRAGLVAGGNGEEDSGPPAPLGAAGNLQLGGEF